MTFIDFNKKLEALTMRFLDSGGSPEICSKLLHDLANDVTFADEDNQRLESESVNHNIWELPDMSTEELAKSLTDLTSPEQK